MRTIFVYPHLAKCGGSAVAEALYLNFGSGFIDTNGVLNDYIYTGDQVRRIIKNFPHLACLSGHKLSLDLPFGDEDIEIIPFTWIRDPVERFISHFFYHRNHTTQVPEAKKMNLVDYAKWAIVDGNQPLYRNGQLQLLAKGSLESVKNAVERNQLFLFPFPKIEEGLLTMANLYPQHFWYPEVKIVNKSRKDIPVDESLREMVSPFMVDDLSLFQLASTAKLVVKEKSKKISHRPTNIRLQLKLAHLLFRGSGYIKRNS